MKKVISIAACAALALGLAACGDSGKGTPEAGKSVEKTKESMIEPLQVTASTTQICDYVTQIAEGSGGVVGLKKTDAASKVTDSTDPKNEAVIELSCLLAPNASAHEHEMTNQQMKALAAAKLFLVNGVDLEHFLDKAIKSSGFKGSIVVTSGEKGKGFGDISSDIKVIVGPEKVKVEKWRFNDPNEEPEFTYDPHVWTSPANASIQVANIGSALSTVDPAHKTAYEKAVKMFADRIKSLDAWAKASFDTVPEAKRVLFTSHDAFGYLSNRYKIKFLGSAIPDFSDLGEAAADHLAKTVQQIKDSGAVAVFAENSNSDKNVQKLAKMAKVKLVNADEALYGDSLGPDGSPGETYIGSIIHNVKSLVTNWGGKVADVPADIKSFDKN